jgi:AcrR family transcriptional regulator
MGNRREHPELDKGELRRQQLLDAAAECFRENGFHGSSIARISQAARMSPGHIYHYFANKEAIVEAIAEREENEMAELLGKLEKDRAGGDLATRFNRQVPQAVKRYSDPAHVSLFLELAAEGARNPAVRDILRHTDEATIREFMALAARVGEPAGMSSAELELRVKLISALFYGLMMRGIVDPAFDRQGLIRLINQVIRVLLDNID